jgi:hypothetical protein
MPRKFREIDMKAVVVIPFYKDSLSTLEKIAIDQCLKVLKGHNIIAIKPDKLNLDDMIPVKSFSDVISFDNDYFAGVSGYNRLMMSAHFYESFLSYEYILIYQLDAFVFSDQLEYWCKQGYDYIGAPWIRSADYTNPFDAIVARIKNYLYVRYNVKYKDGIPKMKRQLEGRVGNGGISLRRVRVFAGYCIKYDALIKNYQLNQEGWFNEDIFWSIELNRKKRRLKMPSAKIALQFAFETHPARALRLNHGQLPFGCHAWDKNLDFWRPIFKEAGYDI